MIINEITNNNLSRNDCGREKDSSVSLKTGIRSCLELKLNHVDSGFYSIHRTTRMKKSSGIGRKRD